MELTIDKYQNIINMLRSTDAENKVVALTIIDQIDIKNNITKILLLKKHSSSNKALWEEHAPKVYAYLVELSDRKLIDAGKHLTYKNVLHAIGQLDVSKEDMEFYMNDFSNYLLEAVKSMGYDYIDKLEITLKYKTHEQDRELSKSV